MIIMKCNNNTLIKLNLVLLSLFFIITIIIIINNIIIYGIKYKINNFKIKIIIMFVLLQ